MTVNGGDSFNAQRHAVHAAIARGSPITPPNMPETVLMKATLRVHFSKFSPDFLPQEIIYTMMRNQVVPPHGKVIPDAAIDWCDNNCSDLWMPSPPERPEYIMFASAQDMDLFLIAHGGG